MLLVSRGKLAVGDVFLFIAGALTAFGILGALVQREHGTRETIDRDRDRVLAGVFDWLSVGGAVGVATLIAQIPSWVAWPLAAFIATIVYFAAFGLQLALVALRRRLLGRLWPAASARSTSAARQTASMSELEAARQTSSMSKLEERVECVSGALASDIAYLVDAGKHPLDPFADADMLAWAIVGCYLEAFLDGMTRPAADLRQRTARMLADRLTTLLAGERHDAPKAETEALLTLALEAARDDKARAQAVEQTVHDALVDYLSSRQLPALIGRELAALIADAASVTGTHTMSEWLAPLRS